MTAIHLPPLVRRSRRALAAAAVFAALMASYAISASVKSTVPVASLSDRFA